MSVKLPAEITSAALEVPDPALTSTHSRFADRLGVGASTVCLIHCLVAPVLFGALPLLGTRGELHELLELSLLSVAGLAAGLSGYIAYQRFRTVQVPLGFAVSVALILGGHALEGVHLGRVLMLLGGFSLVTLHLVSLRCAR
ncbi:MAG: MerC domain-containing protein [Myxococcales bacterium]|nr:MerC domain-containing protein [Myxococcales bacterium]MCB9751299.1 MerC domain-containing protein [Myxococcales bacterium]